MEMACDGRTLVTYSGGGALSAPENFPLDKLNPNQLVLGSYARFRISKLELLSLGSAPPIPVGVPPAEAARQAAQWVLEKGGEAGVLVNGRLVLVKPSGQLPAKPFSLGQVLFHKLEDEDARLDFLAQEPFRNLTYFQVRGAAIDDAALANLQGMASLKILRLVKTKLTDEGVNSLAGLAALTELSLRDNEITDAALEPLARLPALTNLGLVHTRITDAGLTTLATMPQLTRLNLDNTAITDAGLKQLEALKILTTLNVRETQVTAAGVAALKKALPNCVVEFGAAATEDLSQ